MLDISDRALQALAIVCVAIIGIMALVLNNNLGTSVIVAVSGFLGAFARHVWPTSSTADPSEVVKNG